jgi:hypothetical protein
MALMRRRCAVAANDPSAKAEDRGLTAEKRCGKDLRLLKPCVVSLGAEVDAASSLREARQSP